MEDNIKNITSLDDFNFNEDLFDGNEDRWNELISQISKGNVIPVIGPDLLTEPKNGENFHQRLINKLAQWGQVTSHPISFSQLVYDNHFMSKLSGSKLNKDAIYKLLNQLLAKVSEPTHPLLMRLLSTKRFPFVITTSFTPVVENCMREIYGLDNVRILQFNNDSQRSMQVGFGDIQSEKDMAKPTVFYMFGKVCAESHRFVVTDMDMMEFCRTWLTGTGIPRNLTENLKKRYLLFLGGSYSDWLFRFIWFSMRQNATESHRASMFVMPNSQNTHLGGFEQFLERLEAFTQHDPEAVITQIEQRLTKLDESQNKTQNSEPKFNYDVFLSYSRSDIDDAEYLKDELEKRGLSVWFDRQSIGEAENWMHAIKQGIYQSQLFVPLLTCNITQECMEEHEYRIEWQEAAERTKRMGGRAFIIPIAALGFDFYDQVTKLPEEFKELNATWYTSKDELSNAADVIKHKLDELNELKNRLNNA